MSGKNWTAEPWKAAGSLVYFANNSGGLCVDGTPNPNENANLIAAAPDLYEALDSLLSAIDSCTELTPDLLRACEKTLSKARGES